MVLTDKTLQALKPRDKNYKVADGHGLVVEVTKTGTLSFRYRYRFLGKMKVLVLGRYPDMKLADARRAAAEARDLLDGGKDPGAVKQQAKQQTKAGNANTFGAVCALWQDHVWPGLAPSTVEKQKAFLEQHVIPMLGHLPLSDIGVAEVLAVVKRLSARGTLDVARRVHAMVASIFSYAIAHQLTDSNPAKQFETKHVVPHRATRHHTAIVSPAEFGAFLRAIDSHSGKVVRLAAQLSVILFQRPIEMRTMEWSELDLDAAIWNIPNSKMKMRLPHSVPMPRQALAILAEMKSISGNGKYVFPSSRGKGRPMSENTICSAIAAVGYGDSQTAHGLRASARSMCAEQLGFPPEVCEAALAHLPAGALGATYARVAYLEQRRNLHQSWADYCDQLRKPALRMAA